MNGVFTQSQEQLSKDAWNILKRHNQTENKRSEVRKTLARTDSAGRRFDSSIKVESSNLLFKIKRFLRKLKGGGKWTD